MTTTESSSTPPADATPQRSGDAHDDHGPASVAAPSTPARRFSVRRSRLGGLWVGLIGAAAAFAVLLIFVLQNPDSTDITFLWWDGQLPVGVAMLFAALVGILSVAILGTGRIWQLRRGVRHNNRRQP